MAISILNFRSTFIWTETLAGVPGGTLKPQPAFEFLARGDLYQARLQAFLDRADPLGLEPPWGTHGNQLFWKHYLPGSVLLSLSPKQAWKCLLPLRRALPFRIDPGNGGTALVEGFHYPHGIALTITFKYSGARALDDAVALAWTMRRQGVIRENGGPGTPLQDVVNRALGCLREALLGPGAIPGPQRGPFTLSTVLKADWDDWPEPVQADPQLHRALETLAQWPPNPKTARLPELARVCVPLDDPGKVVYARTRGRAVWFPGLFDAAADPGTCSLACYHRNLMFGSMQVDSLGGLVADVAAGLRGGQQLFQLPPALRACAENACERLADLFEGDKRKTYRSRSLQWQIQQNDLADLNFLRQKFFPGAPVLPGLP